AAEKKDSLLTTSKPNSTHLFVVYVQARHVKWKRNGSQRGPEANFMAPARPAFSCVLCVRLFCKIEESNFPAPLEFFTRDVWWRACMMTTAHCSKQCRSLM